MQGESRVVLYGETMSERETPARDWRSWTGDVGKAVFAWRSLVNWDALSAGLAACRYRAGWADYLPGRGELAQNRGSPRQLLEKWFPFLGDRRR